MKNAAYSLLVATAMTSSVAGLAGAQEVEQIWIGEAPFCKAAPSDCQSQGMSYIRSHANGNGDTCLTGVKVLCRGSAQLPPAVSSGPCPANAKDISAALSCDCSASNVGSGMVWGSQPYTADSSICRAARHAGVVSSSGGVVTLTPEPGQSAYQGSSANGVTTRAWKSYPKSFRVSR